MMKTITYPLAIAALLVCATTSQSLADRDSRREVRHKVLEENKDLPPSLRTPRADMAQERLRLAIMKGVESGELTESETNALLRKLDKLQDREKQYKRNDILTGDERKRMMKETKDLADEIWKQSHDSDKRPVPKKE